MTLFVYGMTHCVQQLEKVDTSDVHKVNIFRSVAQYVYENIEYYIQYNNNRRFFDVTNFHPANKTIQWLEEKTASHTEYFIKNEPKTDGSDMPE